MESPGETTPPWGTGSTASIEEVPVPTSTKLNSLEVTGYSRTYLAGHYKDKLLVPRVDVRGTYIQCRGGMEAVKQVRAYKVTRVVSPFEFYMEDEFGHYSQTGDANARYREMQRHYLLSELKPVVYNIYVEKLKYYAYHEKELNTWWRVRVHDIREHDEHALVYFCDCAKQGWVLCSALRELHKDFQEWEAPTLKCYLYDVLPLGGKFYWPIDVVMHFKELVASEYFNAIVMTWTGRKDATYGPLVTMDCGVILFPKSDDITDTVNWTLVKHGYAQPIGIMASSPSLLTLPGMIPEFHCEKQNAEYSPSNVTSREPFPLEKLREITAKAIDPDRWRSQIQRKPSWKTQPIDYLPAPVRDRLAWIKMSSVVGPAKIFVRMQIKLTEQHEMQNQLRLEALELPLPDLVPGNVVTCDMKDLLHPEADCFCRAVIWKVDTENQLAKVILVDFGNVIRVPFGRILSLPEAFRRIPSFAHRIHLSNIRPSFSVGIQPATFSEWSADVSIVFRKYILSFESSWPLYYAFLPENKEIVQFSDVEQRVSFDYTNKEWVAGRVGESTENHFINRMKDDPLLASYFHSYPVCVFYEIKASESAPWKFDDLAQMLVVKDFGAHVDKGVDQSKVHQVVVNGF